MADDQLRLVRERANDERDWDQVWIIDDLIAIRAALKPLAKQALTEEMDVETKDGADYEYAYNEMVRQVRALTAPQAPPQRFGGGTKEGQ